MDTATVFIISIGAVLMAVTVYSLYMSFGPPSGELADPFDDHED